jgi:hypothetical protein
MVQKKFNWKGLLKSDLIGAISGGAGGIEGGPAGIAAGALIGGIVASATFTIEELL